MIFNSTLLEKYIKSEIRSRLALIDICLPYVQLHINYVLLEEQHNRSIMSCRIHYVINNRQLPGRAVQSHRTESAVIVKNNLDLSIQQLVNQLDFK